MNNLTLGEKIKKFRVRSGRRQLDIETEIGIAPGSLSRIEAGKVNPTKETLVKLTDSFELKPVEAASLFGLDISDFGGMLKVTKNLNQSLDLNKILQASVDDIVRELNLLSGFITLIEGDYLYAKTTSDTIVSRISLKIIDKAFNSLRVPLSNKANLMVRCTIDQKIIIGQNIVDFIYPAVSMSIAKTIRKVVGSKAGMALPLSYEGEKLGAIYFGKNYEDDFAFEMDILKEFAEQVGIAIGNARKFQELQKRLEKNG